MWFLVTLAVELGLASLTCAVQLRVATRTPPAFTAATPDQIVPNYAVLQKISGVIPSSRYLRSMQMNEQINGSYGHGTSPIQPVAAGAAYSVPIKLGSSTVQVILDTGSSDT